MALTHLSDGRVILGLDCGCPFVTCEKSYFSKVLSHIEGADYLFAVFLVFNHAFAFTFSYQIESSSCITLLNYPYLRIDHLQLHELYDVRDDCRAVIEDSIGPQNMREYIAFDFVLEGG